MKIYIASSWKNQHGVEMLTKLLREQGHSVISWIENNYEEDHAPNSKMNFEEWVNSANADKSFEFDTRGAMQCDLLIYYPVGGKDAACECGLAFANGVPCIALWAKGEDFGLMRKIFDKWFFRITDILEYTNTLTPSQRIKQ